MAKPDWGTKHTCQSCGAKYYDLQRTPITCPKCGTQFDPDALLRSRRGRSSVAPPEPKAAKKPEKKQVAVAEKVEAADDDEVADEVEDDEDIAVIDDAEEDEDPIEDASELGEDDDDMADVVIDDDKEEV